MNTFNNGEKVIRRLYEITNNYDLGFDTQITQLLKMGLDRFNLDIAILSKIEGNRYLIEHCVAPKDMKLTLGVELDFSNTYCQITCQADSPIAIEHVGAHDEYASHPAYKTIALESYVGMPIKLKGKLYGTLNFSSPKPYPRQFKDVDIDALQLMTSWIEVELIRRFQEQELVKLNWELEKQAYQDCLTSIPNRRAAFRHIRTDIDTINKTKSTAVLAIIDIDFFKLVNDTYGHLKGDKVLISVAQSLFKGKRSEDFLARLGGEEFILWLPNSNITTANIICERIKDNVQALAITDRPVTISFGLTYYNSAELASFKEDSVIDQLISQADEALYQAKDAGRNCIKAHEKIQ